MLNISNESVILLASCEWYGGCWGKLSETFIRNDDAGVFLLAHQINHSVVNCKSRKPKKLFVGLEVARFTKEAENHWS